MKEFNTLDDVNFKDKTVILRADINLPMDRETLEIKDDYRIRKMVPTLQELTRGGARVVILAHQGRPDRWDFVSLEKHAEHISSFTENKVQYVDDLVGEEAKSAVQSIEPGGAILLKNVRSLPYEMENRSPEEHAESELVSELSPLVDLYVNDAFAAAHRSHCSLTGFPYDLPSAAGRLMEKELETLSNLFENPKRPCVFLLGGEKLSGGIEFIRLVIDSGMADWVMLTGLFANFMLMARGVDLGDASEKILEKEVTSRFLEEGEELLWDCGDSIILPHDVAVDMEGTRRELLVGDLPSEFPILDIGSQTIGKLVKVLRSAKTIFFSGPAGMVEREEFAMGTQELMIATAKSEGLSLIGGGHTAAMARNIQLSDSFSYVSTGGGALETYLMGEPLPAVEALKASLR